VGASRAAVDLRGFADEVGVEGDVTISGGGSRGGPCPGVRTVAAPSGIEWIEPDEMTVSCGAGTPTDELAAALAEHGQRTVLPPGGTVGGALAAGLSGIRRLGDGPLRDSLLQARYVSAAGELVMAGGPTVKNVSGFDVCRLLVGSWGTLGFLGSVILRTRPIPASSGWWGADTTEPFAVVALLHRPVSVLWDGAHVRVLLEGHPDDVTDQARRAGLAAQDGPPELPSGSRRLVRPADVILQTGTFVAEIGTGVVHHAEPSPPSPREPGVVAIERRLKDAFDPRRRLNPGRGGA